MWYDTMVIQYTFLNSYSYYELCVVFGYNPSNITPLQICTFSNFRSQTTHGIKCLTMDYYSDTERSQYETTF